MILVLIWIGADAFARTSRITRPRVKGEVIARVRKGRGLKQVTSRILQERVHSRGGGGGCRHKPAAPSIPEPNPKSTRHARRILQIQADY